MYTYTVKRNMTLLEFLKFMIEFAGWRILFCLPKSTAKVFSLQCSCKQTGTFPLSSCCVIAFIHTKPKCYLTVKNWLQMEKRTSLFCLVFSHQLAHVDIWQLPSNILKSYKALDSQIQSLVNQKRILALKICAAQRLVELNMCLQLQT